MFGANEIAIGITGTNYIQSWTGISDSIYNIIYAGLNILSMIGTITGSAYMNYANVNIYDNQIRAISGAKPFQRFTLIDSLGKKQYRFFNSNGNAWFDKDFRHRGENLKFPHYHGWINSTRLKDHWTLLELIDWLF